MPYQRYYYEKPAYVIAGGLVLPFFAVIVTALRFHLRIKQQHPLKADDWLVLPACVSTHDAIKAVSLTTLHRHSL